jgi:hypothetical protein
MPPTAAPLSGNSSRYSGTLHASKHGDNPQSFWNRRTAMYIGGGILGVILLIIIILLLTGNL